MQRRVALYPGTFDPITNGHMDIIQRAVKLVDHLVIGITTAEAKTPLFTIAERVDMVRHETLPLAGNGHAIIEVKSFNSLLMTFAETVGAQMIIRGLRAVSDFEYEFQMVGMNMHLNPEIETVFLMAEPSQQAIASRLVKEIAMLGGDISAFCSSYVAKKLRERVKELRPLERAKPRRK